MTQRGEIRRAVARTSRIHGTGLFATEAIDREDKIIEYTGERITKAEGNRRYEAQAEANKIYLFELNSRYDLDGSVNGNIAKYANHSCDPNAEATIERGRIWLEAMRPIKKGEEITFDYNFPLFDYEKRPCKCGTSKCRGWIINKDSHYYLRRKQREQAKKATAKRARKAPGRSGKSKKTAAKRSKNAATSGAKRRGAGSGTGSRKATKRSARKGARKASRR